MVIGPEEATSGEAATHRLLLLLPAVTPDHTTSRPAGCQIMDDMLLYVWLCAFVCIEPSYYFCRKVVLIMESVREACRHTGEQTLLLHPIKEQRRRGAPPFTTKTHLQTREDGKEHAYISTLFSAYFHSATVILSRGETGKVAQGRSDKINSM